MKIEIYGKESCPFCIKAKNACKSAGIEYIDYVIGKDATKQDVQDRINALGLDITVQTVPQIFVDGDTYIGGYNDLVRAYPWAQVYHSSH